MARNKYDAIESLVAAGIGREDAAALRRISMVLHRWSELEYGDDNGHASFAIERDETTGRPFMAIYPHSGRGMTRFRIADRERGALRRLATIMERYPAFLAHHQGDPRGCSLYIVPKSVLRPGDDLDSVYNRGIAVCR